MVKDKIRNIIAGNDSLEENGGNYLLQGEIEPISCKIKAP